MKNLKHLILCFTLVSLGLYSCKKNDGEPEKETVTPAEAITNVTEQIENKPELSTFKEAFKSVTLSEADVAEGITIFAPTNDAVSEFPNNATGAVRKGAKISGDTSKLTEAVLKDHIVKGVYTVADLTNGKTFTSISGKQYKILRSGDTIRINGVRLNVAASGSSEVIYTVEKILTNTQVTDTVNAPVSACKVSKIVSADDEYQTWEYDSQNRIIKVTDFYKGAADEEYRITYTPTQITMKIYEEGQLEETLNYQVTNGMVSALTTIETDTLQAQETDSLGNTTVRTIVQTRTEEATFQHNADGFITKEIRKSTITEAGRQPTILRDTTSFSYLNGNLVTEVHVSQGGKTTITYEYYTDKLNTLPPNNEDFFLTKANKNPVKKETTVYTYSGQTSTYVSSYTYVYNSKGLITKETMVEGNGPQQSSHVTNFEYSCK